MTYMQQKDIYTQQNVIYKQHSHLHVTKGHLHVSKGHLHIAKGHLLVLTVIYMQRDTQNKQCLHIIGCNDKSKTLETKFNLKSTQTLDRGRKLEIIVYETRR